jgi:hypothetical protein
MTTKYTNAYDGYGATNPRQAIAYLQRTPLGTSPQTYSVVERIDGSTLVASSSYPMHDACVALRARGENPSLTVTMQVLLNNGGWADGESVLLGGYGMQAVGGGSVQAGA